MRMKRNLWYVCMFVLMLCTSFYAHTHTQKNSSHLVSFPLSTSNRIRRFSIRLRFDTEKEFSIFICPDLDGGKQQKHKMRKIERSEKMRTLCARPISAPLNSIWIGQMCANLGTLLHVWLVRSFNIIHLHHNTCVDRYNSKGIFGCDSKQASTSYTRQHRPE